MSVKCKAPCAFRTYGKWTHTWKGRRIPNKNFRPEGSCSFKEGFEITIGKDCKGQCKTFKHWDEEEED